MQDDQRKLLKDSVIVALDVDTLPAALELVEELTPLVDKFKIGSRMFTSVGPRVLDELGDRGASVFLDLKYHDIPSVVGDACRVAATHESVFMLTVHASGGSHMMTAAAEGVATAAHPPMVVAVTALTSLSPSETHLLGIEANLDEWARKLGELAIDTGLDGLVCSAHEAHTFRHAFGEETVLVTPGIRPEGHGGGDDQTRVMTPADALEAGSSFLVIGRPIYAADDPRAAAAAIAKTL